MNVERPVVIEENWESYFYNTQGGPVFVTFYAGAGDLPRAELPFCARVIIPIQHPNDNGGPGDAEAETLWQLEDVLTDTLKQHGVRCLLLARLTHAGSRELVFQLADWDSFRPPVGLWMQHTPQYQVDVSEHDGWSFFDDCIWPSDEDWQLISDRRVVDGLVEAGSNPEREHELEYLFLGAERPLQRLRAELESRGYVAGSPLPVGQLLMVKRLPLDLGQIWSESLDNRRLCEELGLKFDGWGAAVVK